MSQSCLPPVATETDLLEMDITQDDLALYTEMSTDLSMDWRYRDGLIRLHCFYCGDDFEIGKDLHQYQTCPSCGQGNLFTVDSTGEVSTDVEEEDDELDMNIDEIDQLGGGIV